MPRKFISRLGIVSTLVIAASCNSNATTTHNNVTSTPDTRLYGVGGVISAGFPTEVDVFDGPISAATTSVGKITYGNIGGVAVDPTDSTGAVYVSVTAAFSAPPVPPQIAKFVRPNPNGNTPNVTVSGFTNPSAIHFDNAGNLFVLDGNTIYEVKHPITNSSVPQVITKASGSDNFQDFTLDANNNLDVLLFTNPANVSVGNIIRQLPPPYTSVQVSVAAPPYAVHIIFDGAAGLLFVSAIGNLSNTVYDISTYASPITANENPSSQFSIPGIVGALTFDSAGNSFMAVGSNSPIGGSVQVANPPFTGAAAFTFTTPYWYTSLTTGP